jgi:proteasome activator subunit 4
MDQALQLIEPLCTDPDRFKQRAGVEILLGYTRGSKHWPVSDRQRLWDWVMARLPKFFALIKPDTRNLWESFFCVSLVHLIAAIDVHVYNSFK